MIALEPNLKNRPEWINVRVRRQDGPGLEPYWELHKIQYEPELNVISVLQRIAAQATNSDGRKVAPVVWDCGCLEEVCGSCTMVINGQVRQSCSALVDKLLQDNPDELVLEPMNKFPVVRDLMVDRQRLFRALTRVKAWVPVDSYYDMGSGERILRDTQEQNYPLSQCMSCGCCLDACPQYTKVELTKKSDETDEEFEARKLAEFDKDFVGPHAISQAMLFNNHPTGKSLAGERLEALMGPGGIAACGNAQNCVAVCPKEIPLTTSIARAGRATTVQAIKKWFEK
ncbi:succinate dehydrogenase iron-sulfur subunit [Rubripirellula amarantea]|uniref:Fumarate reductase iron-sulfur subunit n=1 Tax=Rubripirellula amarantea TaxID=2527999 RepID=A0A5C5WK92_9BACT|nr:succinate dehydrogenase iron-sulfur subunit [Rubripirellula amarantea]MDA8743953.1 succinate dehydrogenase iron-sulfur subunit [Rubripirellula amarantea]TWT50272.1 Fumarate reductase iron-sulfur subunit [Rubripirellula amarantea]